MRERKNRKKIKPPNSCNSGTENTTSSPRYIREYTAQLLQHRNGHTHEHVHNASEYKINKYLKLKKNPILMTIRWIYWLIQSYPFYI